IDIDDRSFSQALAESYTASSFTEIAGHKWANVQALVGLPWIEPRHIGEGWRAIWRNSEYYNVFRALGVLNVGWLVLAVSRFRRVSGQTLVEARVLLAVALAGLLVWLLLMFGPGTTLIYQGALATVILLFVVLAAVVSTLRRPVVGVLLAAHVLDLI